MIRTNAASEETDMIQEEGHPPGDGNIYDETCEKEKGELSEDTIEKET